MKNSNLAEKQPHYLILFDIDGTMVRMTSGLPGGLFERMVRELFGKELSLKGFSFAGKTDRGILREIGEAAGISPAEMQRREPEMVRWIASELDRQISRDTLKLLPRVQELLERLKDRDDVTLAILTGNLPECASIKLKPYDLEKYFAFGVYGVESEDRNDLGPIALERAIEFLDGRELPNENVVVIGDSVRDVLCAKAIGARVIVTLTSTTTRDDVLPHDPDVIFDDLSDTDAVMRAILGEDK